MNQCWKFSMHQAHKTIVFGPNHEINCPVYTVKQPAKLMIWAAMSAEALTELHIVPETRL